MNVFESGIGPDVDEVVIALGCGLAAYDECERQGNAEKTLNGSSH
jgi:hypothetical protein